MNYQKPSLQICNYYQIMLPDVKCYYLFATSDSLKLFLQMRKNGKVGAVTENVQTLWRREQVIIQKLFFFWEIQLWNKRV